MNERMDGMASGGCADQCELEHSSKLTHVIGRLGGRMRRRIITQEWGGLDQPGRIRFQ